MIIWFTGQPGAGKSKLADCLRRDMESSQRVTVHLDGEWLRDFTGNHDFSDEGRQANVAMMQELALHLAKQGVHVVVSMVSPFLTQREMFKQKGGVVEVYVHTSEQRPREQFKAANYEAPANQYVDINTTGKTIADSAAEVWQKVQPFLVVERALFAHSLRSGY